MKALLIALLVSQTPDAGLADAGVTLKDLYATCPDAPLAEKVDGGFFVPDARQARTDCKEAICTDLATKRLEQPEPTGDSHPGVVLALVGGGTATAIVIFFLGVLVGKSVK